MRTIKGCQIARRIRRLLIEPDGSIGIQSHLVVQVATVVRVSPLVFALGEKVDRSGRIGYFPKIDGRWFFVTIPNQVVHPISVLVQMIMVEVTELVVLVHLTQKVKQLRIYTSMREVAHVSLDSVRIVVLFVGGETLPKSLLNHKQRIIVLRVVHSLLETLAPHLVDATAFHGASETAPVAGVHLE